MHDGDLDALPKPFAALRCGDSPQQEAALYYLAQIAWYTTTHYGAPLLARTIALRGDFERRAVLS